MGYKSVALLLVGLLLGGVGAIFGIGLVNTSPILEDYLPDKYKSQLDDLSQQYQDLSSLHEATMGEVEELQEQYDALDQENQDLRDNLSVLSEEHQTLMEVYNETLVRYESLLMQYEILTGTSPLTPKPPSTDTIRRDFAWVYGGKTWTMSLHIPQYLYDFYSNRTRIPTDDYSVYVTHPYDDEYLMNITERFEEIVSDEDYDGREEVELVVAFIQSLPYTSDSVTTHFDEYPRYPIETLVDGGGDCEDTSILASGLLDHMGYGVVLVNLPEHFGVGVDIDSYGSYYLYEGVKYYYVETTGEGWELGQLPNEYIGDSAVIYPIIPLPVCTLSWTASTLRHKLTLAADIQNVGNAEATGIKVYVGIEGKEGLVYSSAESDFLDLEVEEETTVVLQLTTPYNKLVRIVVYILDPWGNVMEESFSEWFDTD